MTVRAKIVSGAIVLIIGFLSPLLIPLVIQSGMSDTVKSLLSGLLAFGIPEIFMIIAVAIMGKRGYQYLREEAARFLSRILPQQVSRLRYSIGLVMFVVPLLVGFIQPYLIHFLPEFPGLSVNVNALMDVSMLLSLFVLGGEFWEKLKGLFLYDIIATKRQTENA